MSACLFVLGGHVRQHLGGHERVKRVVVLGLRAQVLHAPLLRLCLLPCKRIRNVAPRRLERRRKARRLVGLVVAKQLRGAAGGCRGRGRGGPSRSLLLPPRRQPAYIATSAPRAMVTLENRLRARGNGAKRCTHSVPCSQGRSAPPGLFIVR